MFSISLSQFLISGEDHRFNYHIGFDLIAMLRAIKRRFIDGKIEGASTIQQQIVRVLLNDYRPTFGRKFKEVLLATTLIDIIPKELLPTIYLNIAYYGTQMEGLQDACVKIKSSNPNIQTEVLCAELVARIKYPEPYNPGVNRMLQIQRRKAHLMKLHRKHSNYKLLKIYG
jgi:membrane peptidoglycan carboxypeptidase